jgi:hypothetical protein
MANVEMEPTKETTMAGFRLTTPPLVQTSEVSTRTYWAESKAKVFVLGWVYFAVFWPLGVYF